MSDATLLDPSDDVSGSARPDLRWVGPVVLLLIELVALTLRFDAKSLGDQSGWATGLVSRSHLIVSFGACAGTLSVGLLVLIPARGGRDRRPTSPTGRVAGSWSRLLVHLGAYGGLAWLTGRIFEGGALTSLPLSWVVLWLAAGLGVLSSWMGLLLPWRDWTRLIGNHRGALLIAALAGLAAMAFGAWTASLWGAFHGSTLWASRGVLALFFREIECLPEAFVLGTPRFRVEIAPECSGFEGIGLIWTFLGVCFWWCRHELRFPRALLLLPLGTVLSWGFNVLRIAALIALGDRGWEEMAVGGFHSQAGWLSFNAIALGLVVLARRVPWFSRAAATGEGAPSVSNPTAAYVGPLLAIAVVTMITGAFAEGVFDRYYAARVAAGAVVLWSFRREYGPWSGVGSWPAVAIGLAIFALWTALEPARPHSAEATAIADALARMPTAYARAWLAWRAIGSVIVIPIAEELAFRGFLMRRLIAADFRAVPEGRFTWASFLGSSILFGMLHQRWIAGTIAGMAYALAYHRRGKLSDAIAAHSVTNFCITASVMATGEWYRWS